MGVMASASPTHPPDHQQQQQSMKDNYAHGLLDRIEEYAGGEPSWVVASRCL